MGVYKAGLARLVARKIHTPMSIYKQPSSEFWFVDLAVDGRRIRRSTGTTDKKQAQEYHDRLKADLWRQKSFDETPQRTWDEAVKKYLVEKADKKSLDHDKAMLRWSSPYLRGKLLTAINQPVIDQLIEERRKGHSTRTTEGCSNATINRHMEAIQRVLNCAIRWEWITTAPHIRHLKESEGRLRWLTKEEAERLLGELSYNLKQMARFTLETGLRENNVLELQWSQIDLDRRTMWIHADQAKNGRSMAVPLSAMAMIILAEQKDIHPTLVFSYCGKQVAKASSASWYRALKRAGLDDFTWHGLRHTWASRHVQAGTPLEVLQKLGGWSSLQLVLRYAHLSPGLLAQYADNASAS